MQLLQSSKDWFGDGTFKVAPSLFYQLYTIHVLDSSKIIPCVYAFLPNKQKVTYLHLFQELVNINPRCDPKSFLIDFEEAARQAIEETFPNITVKGCFFHFSQSIYRRVQAAGLQSKYQNEDEFSIKIRMIPALAFLPINNVVEAFETLEEVMPAEAQPILDYFEYTSIGRLRRRNRRAPWFPISMWNMHERVILDLPRTNNSIEGWHNHIQANVAAHHPNMEIFKCAEK